MRSAGQHVAFRNVLRETLSVTACGNMLPHAMQ